MSSPKFLHVCFVCLYLELLNTRKMPKKVGGYNDIITNRNEDQKLYYKCDPS